MYKNYYRWYKYNEDNDIVEVTKDLFPDGDKTINEANGWKRLKSSVLKIKIKDSK
jgi:hypothetical protein